MKLNTINLLILSFLSFNKLAGQIVKGDTTKPILFEEAKFGKIYTKDGLSIFSGEVSFSHDGVYFYADTVIRSDSIVRAKTDVLIQQGDTLSIFGDSLYYNSVTKQCYIYSNVSFIKGDQKLFTNQLAYNTKTKIASYDKSGTFTDGKIWVKSRSCTYNTISDDVDLTGNVYIQDPEFDIKTSRLKYNLERRYVTFLVPTIITQTNNTKIYCERGFYDIDNKHGEFIGNPQFQRNKEKAIANKKMIYDGLEKYYYLEGDARYQDTSRFVSGEVIKYYETREFFEIIGGSKSAFYQDSSQTLKGKNIIYDKKNDNVKTEGRSRLENDENILESDFNNFDNTTGNGISKGNVVWYNKENKTMIFAEESVTDRKNDFVKAYGNRALIRIIQDSDTLHVSADTILSFKADTLATDSNRIMQAYHNVKIMSNQFQGVCDSLYYGTVDSIFKLYRDPVLWSDTTNQYTSDSMFIHVKDNKISRLDLVNHALVITTPEEEYFNQISGKIIKAYFIDGKSDRITVDGSAQTVYYSINENKEYSGVNTLDCSNLIVWIKENELDRIRFYKKNDGKYFPMHMADHGAIQLKGFKWEIERRPMSVKILRENNANVDSFTLSSEDPNQLQALPVSELKDIKVPDDPDPKIKKTQSRRKSK